MADSLTNIADRVAALEAAQSGGGNEVIGAISIGGIQAGMSYNLVTLVFYVRTTQTPWTFIFSGALYVTVTPGYTLYVRAQNGNWYSYVGSTQPQNFDGNNGITAYYFTKQ